MADLHKDKHFQAFTVSLLVHLILFLFIQKTNFAPSQDDTEVEVVYLSSQQFVTHTEVDPKLLEEINKPSRFKSKVDRQVIEETVARHSGETRNRSNRPLHQRFGLAALKAPAQRKNRKGPGEKAKELQVKVDPISAQPVVAPSTISEFIPNVKMGSITALNTNQFTHYAFFSRTNRQIRPRWVNRLKIFSQETGPSAFNKAAKRPRITQVVIFIDRHGLYVGHRVVRTSGIKAVDIAAIDAIIDAAPLINPPTELMKPDGLIHLNYNFIVEFEPRYLVEDRTSDI